MQWKQVKAGCIAVANFISATTTVAAQQTSETLPPPPPRRPNPAAEPPTTFEAEGVRLEAQQLKDLRQLAKERDAQRAQGEATTLDQWRALLERAQYLFRACAFP